MSEPMATSDALSGADGTQLPDPPPVLADPLLTGLDHTTWQDVPELPLLMLPPVPDASAMQEAIAALLGDDAGAAAGAVDQDPATVPEEQPAPQATDQPNAPGASVAGASAPDASVGALPPAAGPVGRPVTPPTWGPPPTGAGDRSPSRRPPRSRPLMAAASRKLVPQVDFRRRTRREHVRPPLPIRSNGGAPALLLLMLIIISLLVYSIITGFLGWVSGLLP